MHYISQFMVLEPGDVGDHRHAAGRGARHVKPPVWLKAGDVMSARRWQASASRVARLVAVPKVATGARHGSRNRKTRAEARARAGSSFVLQGTGGSSGRVGAVADDIGGHRSRRFRRVVRAGAQPASTRPRDRFGSSWAEIISRLAGLCKRQISRRCSASLQAICRVGFLEARRSGCSIRP